MSNVKAGDIFAASGTRHWKAATARVIEVDGATVTIELMIGALVKQHTMPLDLFRAKWVG